jgi:DNA-binding response OmpR family regulator
MIKILIVEDEIIVGLDTKSTLKKLGYEITDIVTNYDETIKSINENKPDIILMDIFLKNSISGIEISKRIKEKYINISIIYISAYCDDKTLSNAIKTEPAGYLVKPFNRNDLKTTINLVAYKLKNNMMNKTIVNKYKLSYNYYYSFDEYLKIYYDTQEILLTRNERLFLEILIKAKGNLVPFTTIEQYIWTDNIVSDSTLRTLLYRLRSKFEHKLIETIPTIGCKLNFD